jgi:hypothetical protein
MQAVQLRLHQLRGPLPEHGALQTGTRNRSRSLQGLAGMRHLRTAGPRRRGAGALVAALGRDGQQVGAVRYNLSRLLLAGWPGDALGWASNSNDCDLFGVQVGSPPLPLAQRQPELPWLTRVAAGVSSRARCPPCTVLSPDFTAVCSGCLPEAPNCHQ